jgi:hypothetical protein
MLPDAALQSIADNLAGLRLDPLLHLKIAVAVVAPLLGQDIAPTEIAEIRNLDKPAETPGRAGRRLSSRSGGAKAGTRKSPLERAWAVMARNPNLTPAELCAKARCGVDTAKKAMAPRSGNGSNNKLQPRFLSAAAMRDPDQRARAYLNAALQRGPDRAPTSTPKWTPQAVQRQHRTRPRRNGYGGGPPLNPARRGCVLRHPPQAADINARVPPKGVRNFKHTGPGARV